MALPDNYTGANAPAKASRFSSLKVFGKFSKEKESLKPPPPPPKDTYYLNNRSLVSLNYPQEPIPPTPPFIGTAYAASSNTMGPSKSQYAASVHSKRPTNPTSSSLSLASSASLVSSPSDIGPSSQQQQQSQPPTKSSAQKISGLFKFRRGAKSPSGRSGIVDDEIMSLQSTGDDENISTPWNFQHNIHVDDALTGLPPSWTVTLAKAGFTEEEIAAIYARKQAGTLTPGNELPYQSYGFDRPRSPAISIASSAASSSLQRPGTAASSGSRNLTWTIGKR
ncbi:hypothetical protein L218DRAFT_1026857 [Marasmius fiardii PR-910]|nr:hypothetical protein L218DRAFT_1026857 [Marasmius fiardii PR-910]